MIDAMVFDARDIVGESLVYDDRRDGLIWVDIGGRRIHRLSLSDGEHEIWIPPDFPTSIGLRRDVARLSAFAIAWRFGISAARSKR